MLIRKSILTVAIVLSSTFAFAEEGGNSGGGGGDAVQTAKGWTMLDLAERLQTKYFAPLAYSGSIEFMDAYRNLGQCRATLPVMNADGTHLLDVKVIHLLQLLFYGQVAGHAKQEDWARKLFIENFGDQLIWVETDQPLSNIADEGVVRLTDITSKTQVAIQKDNVVVVYAPIYQKMDARSKAALVLHELLLRLVLKKNPDHYAQHGTSQIRQLVNALSDPAFEAYPQSAVDQICGPDAPIFKISASK